MHTPEIAIKVLILDDNRIDRESCRRHLSRNAVQKYDFVEHNALDGAMDIVHRENPDCILLDYHLHDGNGVEFLGQLAEAGGPKRFPVVMLTGTGNETIAVQVMKAGAQDYLVKDRLNSELLQKTVESAIYKAQTERLLDQQRVEMERLFQEAQEANSRKDQFLAALSHELRTPLTPVLAAITSTDPVTTDAKQMKEVFSIIRRNIELEARLIDDMLDLTRISRGKLEVNLRPVDLHALLKNAAQTCEDEQATKNISLEWKLDGEVINIQADPARIQQVFWNLLKNALKFTPSGGRVSITTKNAPDGAYIEIADTGIGLQPDLADKIFDAFEQGNSEITRRFGGLGLGLAISKALVEAHGGTIRATNNTPPPGAKFTVFLPQNRMIETAHSEPRSPAAKGFNTPGHGLTVLLVEDHADSAFFIKRMLEASGYRALLAGSIAEALTIFKAEEIDVMVSDLGLPDGRGTELMQQIVAIRPIPAIALSGYGMESDIEKSHEAGFSRHLTKPVDFHQLEEALAALLPYAPPNKPA